MILRGLKAIKHSHKDAMELVRAGGYGQWDEVIEIQKGIEAEGGIVSHSIYGLAYYHLKETEKALYHLHKAIEQDPEDFDSYKYLTNIYYTLGDKQNTIKFASIAIENKKAEAFSETKLVLFLLNFVSFIPKVRKVVDKIKGEVFSHKTQNDKWLDWASKYIETEKS